MDWSQYSSFNESEFRCRHCGRQEMRPEFMGKLQALRSAYGKPLYITSGFRCRDHPVEKAKSSPGMHATGLAADIGVQGAEAVTVLRLALGIGFTGVGVQQKNEKRFLHLDTRALPTIWSY